MLSVSFSIPDIMEKIFEELGSSQEYIKIKSFICFNNVKLGTGKFSDVFFGYNKITKGTLAIKIEKSNSSGDLYEMEKIILMIYYHYHFKNLRVLQNMT